MASWSQTNPQRDWTDDEGSRWQDTQASAGEHALSYMKEATEREIGKSAWVSNEEFAEDPESAGADALDEHEANDELIAEMSLSEGADGRPLPFEETIHRNLYGNDETGNDRPVELRNMQDAAEHLEELQQQLATERAVSDDMAAGGLNNAVERQRNMAWAQADKILDERGMWDPADRARIIQNEETTQIAKQLNEAEIQWGDDFREARDAQLSHLDLTNPRDRQVATSLLWAGHAGGHAGRAIMEKHYGRNFDRAERQQQESRYEYRHGMRLERRAPPQRQQARRAERDDGLEGPSGFGDEATERSIFEDAFRE
jgi:hypothetical protein